MVRGGNYDGVSLGGSVFVLLNLPTDDYAAPKASVLYVESNAGPRKTASIESLVKRYFGPVSVSRAVLSFSGHGAHQRLDVPGLLEYEIVSLRASPADEVKDFLYPWLHDVRQGVTRQVNYTTRDGGKIHYSRTNALVGRFRIVDDP